MPSDSLFLITAVFIVFRMTQVGYSAHRGLVQEPEAQQCRRAAVALHQGRDDVQALLRVAGRRLRTCVPRPVQAAKPGYEVSDCVDHSDAVNFALALQNCYYTARKKLLCLRSCMQVQHCDATIGAKLRRQRSAERHKHLLSLVRCWEPCQARGRELGGIMLPPSSLVGFTETPCSPATSRAPGAGLDGRAVVVAVLRAIGRVELQQDADAVLLAPGHRVVEARRRAFHEPVRGVLHGLYRNV